MNAQEAHFKQLAQFAMQASSAVRQLTEADFNRAIAFGEAQLIPGISLDDALEVEQVLREIKALAAYRKALVNSKLATRGDSLNGNSRD